MDPHISVVYESRKYAFAAEACRTQFNEDRKNSLYHTLGGKPAIDAAVEAFYVKALADDRIKTPPDNRVRFSLLNQPSKY